MSGSDYVEIQYEEVLHETGDAVLVCVDGEEYWLPWSQIEDNGDLDKIRGVLYLRRWLAEEKEIPYWE